MLSCFSKLMRHENSDHRAAFRLQVGQLVIQEVECRSGLSQMQLQKSLEQYQKIPKSVVVQHKIGVPMINVKNRTKYDLQNKLK